MITKVISGGETGVGQAALDAAIKVGIAHGGSISKGRLNEAGPVSEKYQLVEIPTISYSEITRKNVLDSDGTLILSHGNLSGGTRLIQKQTEELKKPCLHADLTDKPVFWVVSNVHQWVTKNVVQVLNITGPSASKDPKIYEMAFYVVEGLLMLSLLKGGAVDSIHDDAVGEYYRKLVTVPKSLEQAVDTLLMALDRETMEIFAGRSENELQYYHNTAGALIIQEFKLLEGNDELLESCRKFTGQPGLDGRGAAVIILEVLWHSLKQTRH